MERKKVSEVASGNILESIIEQSELNQLLREKYPNNDQFELLGQLRERVITAVQEANNELPEIALSIGDDVLHRFLRARSWNVDNAYQQLKKCIIWRHEHKTNDVLREKQSKIFFTITPHAFFGCGKEGQPIFWGQSGRTNVTKLLEKTSMERVNRRHIWSVEKQIVRMKRQSKLRGIYIDTQIMILDLAGLTFSMDSRGSTLFRETIQIDQNYYPELLGHLFIINAPWIFKGMWAFISPWVDPVTSSKIHILGKDYLKTLTQFIEIDQIPMEYGGSADIVVGEWHDQELSFLMDELYEDDSEP